ncbi:MAG: PH domain-containing protein [Halanaeroarchaeum sp.]
MEHLDPRVQVVWALVVVAGAVGITAVLAAALILLTSWGLWPAVGAGLLVLLAGLGHTVLRYRIWSYEVQDDALYLERGVFTRVRTVVPYVRIQHVDTQRNPLERLVGIGSVVVYTAGSRGADVTVPGLEPDRATDLQRRLRSLVGESESEDAV